MILIGGDFSTYLFYRVSFQFLYDVDLILFQNEVSLGILNGGTNTFIIIIIFN